MYVLTNCDYNCHIATAGVSNYGLTHIARLTSLTDLNLDSRLITDAGLSYIKGLTNLLTLDLFGAKVSDIGCIHLRCASTICTSAKACHR